MLKDQQEEDILKGDKTMMLNIGCGDQVHPAWVNLDFVPGHPNVIAHDIRKGLPFPDSTFDVCYTSHFLEHLEPGHAKRVVQECWRVLKPQGILRVVVPDLESTTKEYLLALQRVDENLPEAQADYDWMMIELYDQTVRTTTGGEMGRFLAQQEIINKDFVLSRLGVEAENYWRKTDAPNKSLLQKIKSHKPAEITRKLREKIAEIAVLLIAGPGARTAFREGTFRTSGEIHRWMYDRFSLGRLLQEAGFLNITVCMADESRISNFDTYNFDVVDGKVLHPNSLFMEGQKP